MVEGRRMIVKPDVIEALDGVTAMRGDKTVEKFILPFQGAIKATPGKGASHRFDEGIRLINRVFLTPRKTEGYEIKGGYYFLWHEAAEITDYLLPLFLKLFGPFRARRI